MRISLKAVYDAIEFIQLINTTPLNEIDFIRKDGSKLVIPEKVISDWEFTGLNNRDFLLDIVNKDTEELDKEACEELEYGGIS